MTTHPISADAVVAASILHRFMTLLLTARDARIDDPSLRHTPVLL
jgi:hypothetical protein